MPSKPPAHGAGPGPGPRSGGPPVPVAPPSAGLLWCARPWPPGGSLGRCGPCPAALPLRRASLPAWAPAAPWAALALARAPSAGGGPRSGLWWLWWLPGAAPGSGGRSAYRRAACARRRGPVPPPAGPAAAWPGPAPGGRASPGARPPPRGVWAGGLLSLAAPCRGRCAPAAARPAPLPSSRRVPLPGALPGGPASALGRRASSLRGRLGRLRRPFPRRRPLRGGRSCWCRGGRSLGPGARANPSHPPSRVKTSGASAALDGVCAGWQAVTKGATSRPVIRQAFHSGVDMVEQTCYYRACKGVPQPLALRCP